MNDREAFEAWLARLSKELCYDPLTGIVTRNGVVIGTKHPEGYLRASVAGRVMLLHRVCWFLGTGSWPDSQLDHINGIRADNRLSNLRLATHAENCRNARTPVTNTSGVRGVHWSKRCRKWEVFINHNGRQFHLGRFTDLEEAKKVRLDAELELHGEFATVRREA